jgi:hypothetical protein
MAKYIFLKPFSKTVTVGGVVGIRTFSYKAGDIVEGTVERNKSSEPPNLLVVSGTNGLLKIGFGGREDKGNNRLFKPLETSNNTTTPVKTKGNSTTTSGTTTDTTTTQTQSGLFTTKNIVIGVIVLAVAYYGYKKYVKKGKK